MINLRGEAALICPKCGYEQEERLDCVKCGIVFSKYMALHLGGRQNRAEPFASAAMPETNAEEAPSPEILDLRQSLREVQRRLGDVEFERAERALIKNEIKSLDQRIQNLLEPIAARLTGLEAQIDLLGKAPAPATREEFEHWRGQFQAAMEENRHSLPGQLEALEQKCLAQSQDFSSKLSGRIEALEGSIATIGQQATEVSEHAQRLETAISAQAQELKSSASKAPDSSPSADEIAWMDKAGGRITEVENAVLEIRKEVAQAAEQIEVLQAMLSAHAQEVKALKFESIEGKMTAREKESITRALNQLEALEGTLFEINKGSMQTSERLDALQTGMGAQAQDINSLKLELPPLATTLVNLRESVLDWTARNSDLEKHVAKLEVQVQEVEGKTKDLKESLHQSAIEVQQPKRAEPAPDDLATIRQDLGQIREFMTFLMKKL